MVSADTVSKLRSAINRAIPLMPADMAKRFLTLISPEAIGEIATLLAIWSVSHLVGIGEIIDVAIIGVGVFALGAEAFELTRQFAAFSRTAASAHTDADLDRAAQYFADAVARTSVDVFILVATHRIASAARYAAREVGFTAQLSSSVERLQLLVRDADGVLARLAAQARSTADAERVLKFLRALEDQVPKFQGRPTLRLTRTTERWMRASDTFTDDLATTRQPHVREKLTGRELQGYEQGAYLTKTSSRSGSAVLPAWNRMNILEEQAVPAQSIVLEGAAAPQTSGGAWARGSSQLQLGGGDVQIWHGGQLSPEGKLLPPATRDILSSTAVAPHGKPLHPRN